MVVCECVIIPIIISIVASHHHHHHHPQHPPTSVEPSSYRAMGSMHGGGGFEWLPVLARILSSCSTGGWWRWSLCFRGRDKRQRTHADTQTRSKLRDVLMLLSVFTLLLSKYKWQGSYYSPCVYGSDSGAVQRDTDQHLAHLPLNT